MTEENKQDHNQEEQDQEQDQQQEQGQSVQDQGPNQDKSKGDMNFNKIVSIGFFGGIFWATVSLVLSFFDFNQIGPTFVLERLPLEKWKWINAYIENILAILAIGILSIVIAFIFYFIGRKFTGVLPGVFFGLLLWVIFFVLLGNFAFDLKPIKDYSRDTIVTSICIFILYGTFIAYSVSFAFQEQEPYLRGYSK